MPSLPRSLLAVAVLVVLAGCGQDDERLELSREQLGEQWPLTVERGVLACEDRDLTITADGTTYALGAGGDGTGRGEPIDPVHAEDEELPGARKSLGPLISRALELC
jgi:hypothetical protein